MLNIQPLRGEKRENGWEGLNENKMKPIFAIDPGLICLGWAYLTVKSPDKYPFVICGAISYSPKYTWQERVGLVTKAVFKKVHEFEIENMIIELPDHWSSSTGMAARESGSVFKLTLLIGALYGVAISQNIKTTFVSPREWKGQLPKDIAHNRLRKKLPIPAVLNEKDHNVLDAIAIGWVYLGGKI